MATESPLRLIDSGGTANWAVNKDTTVFSASSGSLVNEELGLLLEGHKYHGNRNIKGPSRSGSAPPSMEGSRVAFDFLKAHQSNNITSSLENLANAVQACKSEEQIRAHPAYLAYYCANVNLNPRLPPPLISRENRHLLHHVGGLGDYLKLPSGDVSNKVTFFTSPPLLSTHKEESEDDKSPRMKSSDWLNRANASSGNLAHSSPGTNEILADSAEDDCSRMPSTICTDHSHPSRCILSERNANQYNRHHYSVDISRPELGGSTSGSHPQHPDPGVQAVISKANAYSTIGLVPCSPSPGGGPKIDSSNEEARLHKNISPNHGAATSLGSVETDMKNLRIYNDSHKSERLGQHPHQVGLSAWDSSSQAQMGQTQLVPEGIRYPHNTLASASHGRSKLSSTEAQQVVQLSSFMQPIYAANAAYGTPYYTNLQSPSFFSSQFGVGGYGINSSVLLSYSTTYPPNYTAFSVPIENSHNPNFSSGSSGISSGGHTPDMQQINKVYGQLGFPIQPSFSDELYVPYFHHPSLDAYVMSGQYNSLIARGNTTGSQLGIYDPQKGPTPSTYLTDQRAKVARVSNINTFNARKGVIIAPNHYGGQPNLGFVQYTSSPVASPAFPGSPAASPSFSGKRNDNAKYPFASGRSAGSGWQGQRGREKIEDPKSMTILEELKSNKAHRFELSDIAGHIVELSADQHGSRFIQQKLETCDAEEKELVFKEVLPHTSMLMVDVFGNYVIQKFFECGAPEQRKELANKLAGNILSLSLQMYGCRVIQKALEAIELDQKTQLVQELDGNILRCVRDQNGNHVIQKCIECVPTEKIGFIICAFRGQVATLSMHPYGCRVIQRVLEHCTDESQTQGIVDEILQSACHLAQDQYGNYVTQHVLERGKPNERSQIIGKLAGQIVRLSQHKFASNVIEKCLVYGSTSERDQLIEEIVGQTEGNNNLLVMMKDQFANYVVQKIFEICTYKQRGVLLDGIKVHIPALKKYTYGKHIVARIEQLCAEDTYASES